jgi:hypothetical protein
MEDAIFDPRCGTCSNVGPFCMIMNVALRMVLVDTNISVVKEFHDFSTPRSLPLATTSSCFSNERQLKGPSGENYYSLALTNHRDLITFDT